MVSLVDDKTDIVQSINFMGCNVVKVCYFGTYRQEYSRNINMINALRAVGVEVQECHIPLWHGIEDRVQSVSGGWKRPSFWKRVIKTYSKLIWKYITEVKTYDVMVVGYPGAFDIPIAKFFCQIKGKKLLWDVLMSIYQVSRERGLVKEEGQRFNFLKAFEKNSARLADLLILDTQTHVDFFADLHELPKGKFGVVRLGADETKFYPHEINANQDKLHVVYYGGFIKNHGVPYIIEAAHSLEDEPVDFILIGRGPEYSHAVNLVERYRLKNVHFLGYLEDAELIQHLRTADICLGVFGKTPQAEVSINNKIYECMAMGKAIITGDSLAVRELAAQETLWACSRDDPANLADAILTLHKEPHLRKTLGSRAKAFFDSECSRPKLGSDFLKLIQDLISTKA